MGLGWITCPLFTFKISWLTPTLITFKMLWNTPTLVTFNMLWITSTWVTFKISRIRHTLFIFYQERFLCSTFHPSDRNFQLNNSWIKNDIESHSPFLFVYPWDEKYNYDLFSFFKFEFIDLDPWPELIFLALYLSCWYISCNLFQLASSWGFNILLKLYSIKSVTFTSNPVLPKNIRKLFLYL